jgi:hypothetical protein
MTKWSWIAQHRWALMGFGGVAVLLAVVAGVWFFMVRSPGTPLSLRQALRLYRTSEKAAHVDDRLPPPGVYKYRTSGSEQLGFAGIARTFPASTTMIVTGSRCDTVDWEALEQHIEETVVCPTSSGALDVKSTVTREQLAGQTVTSIVDCPSRSYLVPPNPWAGERWSSTCSSPGLRVTLTGQVMGTEPVRVGKATVEALHTRLVFHYAGAESGTSPTDYWLSSANGLILRQHETAAVSQSVGPLGSVRYHEQMDLALESLAPAQ